MGLGAFFKERKKFWDYKSELQAVNLSSVTLVALSPKAQRLVEQKPFSFAHVHAQEKTYTYASP